MARTRSARGAAGSAEEVSRTETVELPFRWIEEVELVPIEELNPFANNPRVHPEDQIQRLMASMREWGWTIPIVVDESRGVLAGHGRLEAARRLGIEEVPCLVAEGWSDAQKRAYVIADNRLSETSLWDLTELHRQIDELKEWEFDLTPIDLNLPPAPEIAAELAASLDLLTSMQSEKDAAAAAVGDEDEDEDEGEEAAPARGNIRRLTCPECGHTFDADFG